MPRSPKGRAVARGLDARLHLQHAFMPAGYASLKTAQVNQKCRLTVITVSTATLAAYSTSDGHPPRDQTRSAILPCHATITCQGVGFSIPYFG